MGKMEQAYKNEMTDKRDEVFEGVQGEILPFAERQYPRRAPVLMILLEKFPQDIWRAMS